MLKAKKYDWKDSNMALFGSDTEKKVKKESAEAEEAWAETEGLEGTKTVVFRIVKFKVKQWDKEQYGEFYNGDSYIIYRQTKIEGEEKLQKDVHFWIGKYSTQDEYGTAAYKTVELDTFHDDEPVQHREVEGHESKLFKSYFESMTLLKGGADTGFRRVLPEVYEPRLFHVKKEDNKKITCKQIPRKRGNLKDADVFILDAGEKIYVYAGKDCSHDEKFKAAQEVNKIKSARGGKAKVENVDGNSVSEHHPMFALLKDGESKQKEKKEYTSKLFRVSDADGSLDMDEVASVASGRDNITKDLLTSDDVYIVDFGGEHCFCWIGSGASIDERKNGLSYASNYLNKTEYPWAPITVVAQGKETAAFNKFFQ